MIFYLCRKYFMNKKNSVLQINNPNTTKIECDANKAILDTLEANESLEIIKTICKLYPEMKWLTWDIAISPEKSVSTQKDETLGKKLFPNLSEDQLIEFNRTAVGLICLYQAYKGWNNNYKDFTECQQDSPKKLTKQSFDELHKYTKKILKNENDFNAMIIYTVINDLWKIKEIIDQIQSKKYTDFAMENISHQKSIEAIISYAIKNNLGKIEDIVRTIKEEVEDANVDHDKLLLEGLETYSDISPSYNSLSKSHQESLLTWLRWEFNMGQFIQGENIPASLEKLIDMDEKSFDFYMIHFLYDLAWASGQSIQNGSIVMTESTYQSWQKAYNALKLLRKGKSIVEVYDDYLSQRGKELELDINNPSDKAITRLCCMLRYDSPQQAIQVKKVFNNLPKNTKAILETELNKNGVDDGYGILIYYAPAILVNLQKKMENNSVKALELWFKTLARIYQEARILLKKRKWNGIYTVMASDIAIMLSKTPKNIDKFELNLKSIWNDAKISLKKFPKINSKKFSSLSSLSEIPWDSILPIGMWWGSDCVQAAQLATLLAKKWKKIPAIVSIRTNKTSSQWINGKIGEDRTPKNAKEISDGIFLIKSKTKMKGRAVEPRIAKNFPTYLILIKDWVNLSKQIKLLLQYIWNIDTVIWVDTGWDALYSTTGHDEAKATPDQDILVLKAINKLENIHTLSVEIAVWIDTPNNGEEILKKANAKYFEPKKKEIKIIMNQYKKWEMDGTNDKYFWKTPLSWQKALKNKYWLQSIDLPTRVVIDHKNPWNPFVNIQASTKWMFFMNTNQHIKAISK